MTNDRQGEKDTTAGRRAREARARDSQLALGIVIGLVTGVMFYVGAGSWLGFGLIGLVLLNWFMQTLSAISRK